MLDNQKAIKIRFWGELGKRFHKEYSLAVSSVSESLHAINVNSGYKLYPWLLERDKAGIKYKLLINNRPFKTDENLNDLRNVANTELTINNDNLRTIDIVPVIEGADSDILGIFTVILGIVLIATGAFSGLGAAIFGTAFTSGLQAGLIIGGLALLAGGISTLLAKPPTFEDFREIESGGGRASYLFNGPQNVTNEGGPVPVGYGRLIVGSQVISASYDVSNINAGADDLLLADTLPGAIVIDNINTILDDNSDITSNILTEGSTGVVHRFNVDSIVRGFDLNYRSAIVIPRISMKRQLRETGATFDIGKSVIVVGEDTDGSIHNPPNLIHPTDTAKEPTIYSIKQSGSITNQICVIGGDFGVVRSTGNRLIPITTSIVNLVILFQGKDSVSADSHTFAATNGAVHNIYIDSNDSNSNIFICGNFTTVGSVSNTRISKIVRSGNNFTPTSLADLATGGGANNIVRSIITDGSGNIYVCGDFTSMNGDATIKRFAKLTSTGALAGGFTQTTIDDNSANDIKLDSNNKILIAGNFTSAGSSSSRKNIIRLNTDGTIDTTFTSPTLTGTDATIRTIAIQGNDNKIFIGGKWDYIFDGVTTHVTKDAARLNSDGTIDTTFGARFDQTENTDPNGGVHKILVRDTYTNSKIVDGRILLGGKWKTYFGGSDNRPLPYTNNFVMLHNGDYLA